LNKQELKKKESNLSSLPYLRLLLSRYVPI
jgi:hypothetical protein